MAKRKSAKVEEVRSKLSRHTQLPPDQLARIAVDEIVDEKARAALRKAIEEVAIAKKAAKRKPLQTRKRSKVARGVA